MGTKKGTQQKRKVKSLLDHRLLREQVLLNGRVLERLQVQCTEQTLVNQVDQRLVAPAGLHDHRDRRHPVAQSLRKSDCNCSESLLSQKTDANQIPYQNKF